MLLLLTLLVGLTVVGFAMLIHATYVAPEGAEGENGFYVTVPGQPALQAHPVLAARDVRFFER